MKRSAAKRASVALLALLATILGALGWGIGTGGAGGGIVEVVDRSPSCVAPSPSPGGALSFHDSRLDAALVRAAAHAPGSPIRLWTDAVAEMPSLPAVPVDVVLLPRRDNLACLGIRLPERIAPGVEFTVEVDVGRTAGPAAAAVACGVRIERDGERLGAASYGLLLARGERRTVRVRDRVERAGIVRYRATLSDPVGDAADDSVEGAMRVGEGSFALRIGLSDRALPGFEARTLRPEEAAAFLADPAVRGAIDAILIDGPLPDASGQEAIAQCVQGGTGLLLAGGRGAHGTPLGDLLPLTDQPPGGRATLLLVDLSGSMEPRRDALVEGIERLRAVLEGEDRIAIVLFRNEVIGGPQWQRATEARWSLGTLRPQGGTLLLPALAAARDLFEGTPGATRRLLVLSDGEWGDRRRPEVARALEALRQQGVATAALFVDDDPPAEAIALFPSHARAGGDLPASLLRLEEGATDRRIEGPLPVSGGDAAGWLRDALPPPLPCRALHRLYPRGVGERIVLRAEEVPLLATLEPAGRVVQLAAPPDDGNPHLAAATGALLHAVARRTPESSIRAWREGADLVVEVRGPEDAPLLVGERELESRPLSPGRRRALLRFAPPGPLTITCGHAIRIVPPRSSMELDGLYPRREVAAAIAQRTGGRLYENGDLPEERPVAPAVHRTLLLAALLAFMGALWRGLAPE